MPRHLIPTAVICLSVLGHACVPQAFQQTDFRSHLSNEEKTRLKSGQVVDKMHVSYWRFKPSQIYWQGPLMVTSKSGKLFFSQHGTWKRFHMNGALSEETVFTDSLRSYSRLYAEDGSLVLDSYSVLKRVSNRNFSEMVDIEFRGGNQKDTVMIRRWGYFHDKNGTALDERISFDSQGKRQPLEKLKSL